MPYSSVTNLRLYEYPGEEEEELRREDIPIHARRASGRNGCCGGFGRSRPFFMIGIANDV